MAPEWERPAALPPPAAPATRLRSAAQWRDSEHGSDPAPQLMPTERRVVDACRVELDKDGNVLTHIPALLAGAVARLVEAAAVVDAARGGPHAAATAPPPFAGATRLHGCRPPGISVEAYAARLLRYARCSPVCFVAAFAYMRRLQTGGAAGRGAPVRVDGLTAHRLMAVGLVVATKFYDDKYYSNGHYAEVAGVSLRELNAMEVDLLFRLGFRARCSHAELCEALAEMEALAAGCSGRSPMLAAMVGLPGYGGGGATAAAAAAAELAVAAQTARGAAGATPAGPAPEESCSAATSVGANLAACSAGAGELGSCGSSAAARLAAAAPLPWGAAPAAAAAAAAEDPSNRGAPPRRSKKRCSMEAQHGLRSSHDERPHFAEPLCPA